MTTSRRWRILLVLTLLPVAVMSGLAGAAAATTGTIQGTAVDRDGTRLSRVTVRLFSVDASGGWAYRTSVKASSRGDFELAEVRPGRYVLQFVDTRPSWDKTKHVTTDVKATVPDTGATVRVNGFMPRGAYLYGTVRTRKGPGRSAIVRAVRDGDTTGTVYSVRADRSGGYCLGGLPTGRYTVFGYDAAKTWSAKPRRAHLSRLGQGKGVGFAMNTRAGRYSGRIRAGGISLSESPFVTAVNRSTGQFYVVQVFSGNLVSLRGLAPGRYSLMVPGVDHYLGRTFSLPAVRAGRTTAAGHLDLTRQGGLLTGQVVDAGTKKALPGVEVTIYDKYDHPFDTVRTNAAGWFTVGGSIPDSDDPASLTIRARNPIDEIRYVERARIGPYVLTAGSTAQVGTIALTRVPSPTPTPTTSPTPTASPTPSATTSVSP